MALNAMNGNFSEERNVKMKIKQKFIFSLYFLFFILISLSFASAMANPAAVYCRESGYTYEIKTDSAGEYGVCVFTDETSCDDWAFYEGKCGEAFAKKIDISEKLQGAKLARESASGLKLFSSAESSLNDFDLPPAEFDWRNYSSNNWMTSVKDQASCGSCWAFSALGAVESAYNIYNNDSTIDLDLSEQELVSCCFNSSVCPLSAKCEGGQPDESLNYTKYNGTTDESCFAYTHTNDSCGNRCADAANRTYTINDWGWIVNTTSAMKQALIDYGPLSVGVYWNGTAFDNSSDENHAVVLVGYNDSSSEWIIKNSWGTGWGDNGYGTISYGFIEIYDYILAIDGTETKPNVTLVTPVANANLSSQSVTFNCSASDSDGIHGLKNITLYCNFTGTWLANETKEISGTNNFTAFAKNLSDGVYIWNCMAYDARDLQDWADANRTLKIDSSALVITINSPANTSYNNSTQLVNISANDSGCGVNMTWYDWNGTNATYSSPENITFAEGNNTLIAYANDSAGNENSTNVTFTIDTTIANISVISPTNITYLTHLIWINATATENISNWIINYNGTNASLTINTTRNIESGSFNLKLYANDTAGNIGLNNSTWFTVAAPTTTLNLPANNSNSTSSSVTFNCSVNDSAELMNVTLYGNFTGTWVANESKNLTGNSNSTTFTKTLSDKKYVWNCLAYNNESGYDWGDANYTLTVDTIAPTITDISNGGTTTSSSANLTAETNENAICKYDSDDVAYNSMEDIFSHTNNLEHWTSVSLDLGENTFYVRCKDVYGNMDPSSEEVTWTREEEEDDSSGNNGGSNTNTDEDIETSNEQILTPLLVTANPVSQEVAETTKVLRQNEKISFNLGTAVHEVKVQKISATSATIEISSNPITATLMINESKDFDVDNNSVLDLRVKLVNITGTGSSRAAELLISALNNLKLSSINVTTLNNSASPSNAALQFIDDNMVYIILIVFGAGLSIIFLITRLLAFRKGLISANRGRKKIKINPKPRKTPWHVDVRMKLLQHSLRVDVK